MMTSYQDLWLNREAGKIERLVDEMMTSYRYIVLFFSFLLFLLIIPAGLFFFF
ncbi:hypothetical protein Syun_004902 [Stephania yunnanensis]|uniref:Uncharacterized protein n=1 Tax=Stephania yunnanensis TaxID=152371 RepID=A0AAP0L4T7_9MAGN